MGIKIYNSEEEMEQAFEDMMETEQEKVWLKEEIEHKEWEMETARIEHDNRKDELTELLRQLRELEEDNNE